MSEEKKKRKKLDPERFEKATERALAVIEDYTKAGLRRYEEKHGPKSLANNDTVAKLVKQIITQALTETSFMLDAEFEVVYNKQNEFFVPMNGRIFDENSDFRPKELNIAFGTQHSSR